LVNPRPIFVNLRLGLSAIVQPIETGAAQRRWTNAAAAPAGLLMMIFLRFKFVWLVQGFLLILRLDICVLPTTGTLKHFCDLNLKMRRNCDTEPNKKFINSCKHI
jgi:hypothetical protein